MWGHAAAASLRKIHARVDAQGRPVQLLISPGNDHDVAHAEPLLEGIEHGAVVIADKGYDADGVRACIRDHGAIPNIPNRSNRKTKFRWKKAIYRQCNHVERFFNKLKQFRRVATRYDKLGANFFAFVKLASVRIWLRINRVYGLVRWGVEVHGHVLFLREAVEHTFERELTPNAALLDAAIGMTGRRPRP